MKKTRLIMAGVFLFFNVAFSLSFTAQAADPLPQKFMLKPKCACGPTVTLINHQQSCVVNRVTEYWENFENTDNKMWTFSPITSNPYQLEGIYGGWYTVSIAATFPDPDNITGTLVAKDFHGNVIASEMLGSRIPPLTFDAYCGDYTVEILP